MKIYHLATIPSIYQGLEPESSSTYKGSYLEDIVYKCYLLNKGKSINEILDPNDPYMGIFIKPLIEKGIGNTIKKIFEYEPIKVFYTRKNKTHFGKKIKKGDILPFYGGSLAFSKKALDVLGEEFLYKNGEIMNLECEDGITYYALNLLTSLDIIQDSEKETCDSYIMKINLKDNINLDEINKTGIFRIKLKEPHNSMSTYVSQSFVDRVKEAKLDAFLFTIATSDGFKTII